MKQVDEGLSRTIARLRQLEAAATPGPWEVSIIREFLKAGENADIVSNLPLPDEFEYPDRSDAKFIAEMRNALPQLLDRLEKLEAVADAHKAFVAYCEDRFTWSAKPGEWEYMSDEIELKHARDALATPEQVK